MSGFTRLLPALPACLAALLSGPVAAAVPTGLDQEANAFLAMVPLTASAAGIRQRCIQTLELAKRARKTLEARTGPATIDADFAAFDTLNLVLDDGRSEMGLIAETSPVKAVRAAADACVPQLSDAATAVGLSRPIYDRLSAIPVEGLDAATVYTLEKLLKSYRLSGVDKDLATRLKVTALQKKITKTGLRFAKNIREDKGDVRLNAEELAGMPRDFLALHKPGKDGLVHLTVDNPDVMPVLEFASLRETRRKVFAASQNRAYPANEKVLQRLLEQRYALAQLLGRADFAALVTADKMVSTPQRVAELIAQVETAAQPAALADLAEQLTIAKTVDPSITHLERYDRTYMLNLLRKQKYAVDAAEVRQFFTFDKARTGIFALVQDLFGAEIRPWNTQVWDPSVSAWELYEGDQLLGRFYLDMHPREGKYSHAAEFPLRTGVAGRQIPVAALVCNMPATGPLGHADVVTFLHEFGHLLHSIYSGHNRFGIQTMGYLQWDFIEAPSQMLEEWAWDYDTLKTFASNEEGMQIPADLVSRMNAGRRLGDAVNWKQQLAYSAVSLNFYNRKPDFNLDSLYDEMMTRHAPYPPVAGTHPYASFSHLDGYSAIYYTYVWSKAIAVDLFTKFKAAGMRDQAVAMQYRRQVLQPGSSRDANALIETFLGRPVSLASFRDELQRAPAATR
ncbi:MAG: M3 family metallopeptidase [Steroidobacteraceae bacterium]